MSVAIKEMMQKTGLVVVGVVRNFNSFTSDKGRTYYSVDLDVQGCRLPVNVKLPDGYPLGKLQEYELAKLALQVRPNFQKNGLELHAVAE